MAVGVQSVTRAPRDQAPGSTARLDLVALGSAGLAALVAMTGLLGWLLDFDRLTSISSSFIPIAPSTSVCFILLAVVIAAVLERRARPLRPIALAIAGLVALFGLLEVPGHFTGLDLNLEDWLVPPAGHLGSVPMARMSPGTGALFLVAGIATILFTEAEHRPGALRLRGYAALLGCSVFLAGTTFVLGYVYGTPLMYNGSTIPVAAPTALAFTLLGLALATAPGGSAFPVRLLVGPGTSARLLRAILPLMLLALAMQGGLHRFGPALFGINDAMMTAALAVAVVVATALGMSAFSRRFLTALDHAEEKRRKAEEERLQYQQRLQQDQKMQAIGTLAGGVAHDINNVLGVIIAFAHTARNELDPSSKPHADLNVIIEAVERGSRLTGNLLRFARRGAVEWKRVGMAEVVGQAHHILERTISKKISIRVTIEEPEPHVDGDAALLTQAVMNLCLNAVDAMEGDGELSISVRVVELTASDLTEGHGPKPGRFVEIRVADNGCGMDPETRDHAFDPFFTTKTGAGGSGLGLPMVFGTVETHGGVVNIDSTVGYGTAVTIHLPAADVPEDGLVADADASNDHAEHSGVVLVIDDEEMIRNGLKRVLEQRGYDVLLAENGRAGVDLYSSRRGDIDAVIIDMRMPVMDGRECFESLRKIDPEIHVILCSGYSDESVARDMLAGGGMALLRKPFDADELVGLVAKAVRREL